MSEPLKTVTISQDDIPVYSILRGHVLTETFNDAFLNEGWRGVPRWNDEDVTHEYWVEEKDTWVCSNKYDERAVPVTVGAWYPTNEIYPLPRKVH